jgi:DNA-binding transcriptional LysR family regulator
MENEAPTWDDLRVLLALHRHRSFLAAGRALGFSTSTVARRIHALETALGRTLVHRSSSGTSVEPDALELVSLAEQLEHGLEAARRDEKTPGSRLAGTVRVSVGDGFIRPLTQALSEVRRKHPEIHVELVSESRLSDLARREADLGIRTARSSSSVVVDRPLGTLQFGLFASQSYVERRLRGARLRDGDYARHDFVGFEGALRKLPQEQWLVARGAIRFPFRSNSDVALLDATQRGQGIAMLAQPIARDIEGVVLLEVDGTLPRVPIFLAFHRELRKVPRVRAVAGVIESAFRARLGR